MNSSAESFGQLVGLGICIILPLVLIILNGVSIRRRSTNALCALAIIGTLLAIILFSLSGMGARTTHVPLEVLTALTITGGTLMLISTVLATIGLIRCLTRRRYTRGRWRAVIALCLNALFLTFLTINIVSGVNQGLAWRKLMQPTSSAGIAVTNDAWNFTLQPPPEWSQIDPVALNADAQAAFTRRDPEIFAMVVAENLPDGAEAPLSAAMEILKRTLSANGTKVEFLAEVERMNKDDMLVRTMEMRSHETPGGIFHVHCITRASGALYRITVWGADIHAAKIREEAQRIFDGFEIIDTKRRTKAKPKPTVAMLLPLAGKSGR